MFILYNYILFLLSIPFSSSFFGVVLGSEVGIIRLLFVWLIPVFRTLSRIVKLWSWSFIEKLHDQFFLIPVRYLFVLQVYTRRRIVFVLIFLLEF